MSIFNKKKIGDFIIYGVGQAINIAGPLLVMPHIISVCGVAGLGKVGVGMSLALILNGIIDYGSYINGVKDISVNRTDPGILQTKFASIYYSKLLLFVGVLALVIPMLFWIPYFYEDRHLFLLSMVIVLAQLVNPAWFLQGVENFKCISFINVGGKVFYIAMVFLFITEPKDYILANLFFGGGALLANIVGLLWLMKNYSLSLFASSFKSAVTILTDEFNLTVSQFFLSIYQFFPIMLISYIGGDLMAGQFRIIDQIVSIFKTYLNMFFYFVFSNICLEISKSVRTGLRVWKQYNGLNFILLSFGILIFIFGSDILFQFFKLTPGQADMLQPDFRLALAIPLLVGISQPLRQLMFAFNHNRIYIRITIASTILNLLLFLLLVGAFGLSGAFISIILIEVIIIVLYTLVLSRHFKKTI
jgi:O-antigen/teichoic acid export membrane protein